MTKGKTQSWGLGANGPTLGAAGWGMICWQMRSRSRAESDGTKDTFSWHAAEILRASSAHANARSRSRKATLTELYGRDVPQRHSLSLPLSTPPAAQG